MTILSWLLSLLVLCSCQRHSQWQYCHVPTKESFCTRVLYKTQDPTQGIDVEFLYHDQEMTTYLQVHSRPLLPSKEDHQKAQVRLRSDEKELSFAADFHGGHQRIRLSSSLQSTLISLLKEGKPVVIEMEGYREIIHPKQFEKIFKKLDHPPYKTPIHLPI